MSAKLLSLAILALDFATPTLSMPRFTLPVHLAKNELHGDLATKAENIPTKLHYRRRNGSVMETCLLGGSDQNHAKCPEDLTNSADYICSVGGTEPHYEMCPGLTTEERPVAEEKFVCSADVENTNLMPCPEHPVGGPLQIPKHIFGKKFNSKDSGTAKNLGKKLAGAMEDDYFMELEALHKTAGVEDVKLAQMSRAHARYSPTKPSKEVGGATPTHPHQTCETFIEPVNLDRRSTIFTSPYRTATLCQTIEEDIKLDRKSTIRTPPSPTLIPPIVVDGLRFGLTTNPFARSIATDSINIATPVSDARSSPSPTISASEEIGVSPTGSSKFVASPSLSAPVKNENGDDSNSIEARQWAELPFEISRAEWAYWNEDEKHDCCNDPAYGDYEEIPGPPRQKIDKFKSRGKKHDKPKTATNSENRLPRRSSVVEEDTVVATTTVSLLLFPSNFNHRTPTTLITSTTKKHKDLASEGIEKRAEITSTATAIVYPTVTRVSKHKSQN